MSQHDERGGRSRHHDEPARDETAPVPPPEEIRRIGLANALREVTAPLHRVAERAGVISDIVRGRSSRAAYALLLRNLYAVYDALEAGLERHRDSPAVGRLARPEVYRAEALRRDLATLYGGIDVALAVPLLPAGAEYVDAVIDAGAGDGVRLIGHAYTRYLGDLSGGQTVSRVLAQTLGLAPDARHLYAFDVVEPLDAYKERYRDAIDQAAHETERPDAILAEAMRAFRLNVALFWAVKDATEAPDTAPTVAAVPSSGTGAHQ
ncbi:biliverdin-producing heme oxygenase [Rhodoplanes serenus]|uniref:Biliverdin-producing heme oxygenase n=1 Tax=Rhodoplanes serenus TaxID=200615 RepID=A0A9X5AQ14_9BRAD|nr:biliverdin-producing heme oxygenase [Rhodoplanes serenus]MTW14687.1 biliverdin-producing heme oxygenase [Rhodoplanes serenus]